MAGGMRFGIIPGGFTHTITRAVVSSLIVVVAFSFLGRKELSPAQEIDAVIVFVYIAFF